MKLPLGVIGTSGRIAPVGRVLNRCDPLVPRLVWCAAPSIYGTREMVSGAPGGYVSGGGNNGTFSAKTRLGMAGGTLNNTADGLFWPYSAHLERITRNYTFVFWIVKTTDTFSYIWTKNYNGSTVFAVSLNVEYNLNNNSFDTRYLDSGGSTGPNYKALGPSNMYTAGSDGLACIAICRSGANVDFYRDGTFRGNDTFGVNNDIDWNTREDVTVFTRNSFNPGDSTEGYMPLCMLFAGALPKGEIISLYNYPFRLFHQNVGPLDVITADVFKRGLFPFYMNSLRQ